MNPSILDANVMRYSTVETLLDGVSRTKAATNTARYCRPQHAQRTSGSIRVSKPGSTSNSPRSSTIGRRMTDGSYRRRLAMMEQNVVASGNFATNDGLFPTTQQAARPVSWHPSSQETTYQQAYSSHYAPTTNSYPQFEISSTPTVYSAYGTPVSSFSPISTPYSGFEQHNYTPQPRPHSYHHTNIPYAVQSSTPVTTNTDPSMYSQFDWSNFASNGSEDSTTPPTPDNFLRIQHPEPTFSTDDSIPYHSLDDAHDTGEELIGLGLYDSPEGAKSPESDPYLDNYRSSMVFQLMGASYRRPEPTRRGLKLEETWEPPASDEGEEDDDEEEDGEGEDDEPEQPAVEQHNYNTFAVDSRAVSNGYPAYIGHGNSRDGWL